MRKGFTLIELLIVIAIISILLAIAIPNFIEAKHRAMFKEKGYSALVAHYGQEDVDSWEKITDEKTKAEILLAKRLEQKNGSAIGGSTSNVKPEAENNNVYVERFKREIKIIDSLNSFTISEPLSGKSDETYQRIAEELKKRNKVYDNIILITKENYTYKIFLK